MHHPRFLVPAFALALAAGASPTALFAADAGATSFEDAIKSGSYGGMLRYRIDSYDEDNLDSQEPALASTLRTSLFYGTKPLYGLSGFVELYHVASVGPEHYFNGSGVGGEGFTERDFVIDPTGMGVNQAYGQYKPEIAMPVTLTVGRQLFTINDETFLTASRYRQNNNRMDAATASITPFDHLTIELGQIWHNIDVTDTVVPMSTQVANVAYSIPDKARIAAYGIMLDYTNDPIPGSAATGLNFAAIDRETFGLRLEGPWKIDDKLSLIYEADYAKQQDWKDTTDVGLNIDASMVTARGGLSYDQWYGSVGYRRMSGAKETGDLAFQSSDLGYPWPWRGNSEQFVFSPPEGLQTIMVWVGGAIPGVEGLSFDAFYFNFKSVEDSIAYGSEISGGFNYNITKRWSLYGLATKATQGDDVSPFHDATRLTGMTTFTF
jgi:hypothetical protein